MAISIDHHGIMQALKEFKLEVTDYYLEFTERCVYMYWVACPSDIQEYLAKDDWTCLDFQVKGKWIPAEEMFAKPFTERPFTNCRYILETD